MQGKVNVIAALNEALKEELTAINQYFLHAEMCENWHYHKLGDYIKKQSIDEMKHVEALIERILFLNGTPNMTELLHLTVMPEQRLTVFGIQTMPLQRCRKNRRLVLVITEEPERR
jgi:bacterioferritin